MEIREIIELLNDRWDSLVEDLIPSAVKRSGFYECGDLSGARGQSLKLYRGVKAGAWRDYSTDESGDALILIEVLCTGGNRAEAIKWAKGWLGLEDSTPEQLARRQQAARANAAKRDRAMKVDQAQKREKAKGMFLHGERALRGTPVDHYLRGRGIDLNILKRQPAAIRYHNNAYEPQSRLGLPAMVACITGADGFLATHVTYLQQIAHNEWVKADVDPVKRVYGSYAGGSIPIWRGASGKSLRDAPEGDRIVLTEGIEDALSMAIVDPSLRVHAAVSLSNLANVYLPRAVREVVLCRQNDWDNPKAVASFDKAMAAFAAHGRTVIDFRTPENMGKDPNDWLRHATRGGRMKLHQLISILEAASEHDPMADVAFSDDGYLLVTSEFLPPTLADLDGVVIAGRCAFSVDIEAMITDSTMIG